VQRAAIENASEQQKRTRQRLERAERHCREGGLARLPLDEMEKRFAEQEEACNADSAAIDAIYDALRVAGLNV
jgi:hypothetical protein